jgi:hypothetical protein
VPSCHLEKYKGGSGICQSPSLSVHFTVQAESIGDPGEATGYVVLILPIVVE